MEKLTILELLWWHISAFKQNYIFLPRLFLPSECSPYPNTGLIIILYFPLFSCLVHSIESLQYLQQGLYMVCNTCKKILVKNRFSHIMDQILTHLKSNEIPCHYSGTAHNLLVLCICLHLDFH